MQNSNRMEPACLNPGPSGRTEQTLITVDTIIWKKTKKQTPCQRLPTFCLYITMDDGKNGRKTKIWCNFSDNNN